MQQYSHAELTVSQAEPLLSLLLSFFTALGVTSHHKPIIHEEGPTNVPQHSQKGNQPQCLTD